MDRMERYKKLEISMRSYLFGKAYYKALGALEYAREKTPGMRKDGKTPSFEHQYEIAFFVSSLKDVRNPELLFVGSFLHDLQEDMDISRFEIRNRFGEDAERVVWKMTKKFEGQKKTTEIYFGELAEDPDASLLKGADRIHNIQSMVGVFTVEKQKLYIEEVETWILPMLKKARHNFPDQSAAYFSISHMLKTQIALIRAMHEAVKEA